MAEIERSNAAILAYWITEAARDPGAEIEPLRTDETGADHSRYRAARLRRSHGALLRVGLEVASRYVLDAAFATLSDPVLLRDTLAVIVASASRYIDRSIDMLRELMDAGARRGTAPRRGAPP